MALSTPRMGSQTRARRISLVRGVVAWAWVMDVLKVKVLLVSPRGASKVEELLQVGCG
jgi:hypothetical protein